MRVVDFYMNAVKKALPHATCFTYSDYIHENAGSIFEVLKAASLGAIHLWSRKVSRDGVVEKMSPETWDDITNVGIYGVTNHESGWLIPNPMNILLHNTVDLSESGQVATYLEPAGRV